VRSPLAAHSVRFGYEPHRPVYDGGQLTSAAYHWRRAQEQIDAAIDAARTDLGAARQILAMFTFACRTLVSFNRERQFLIDTGVPRTLSPWPLRVRPR